jgi:hypothetical protein
LRRCIMEGITGRVDQEDGSRDQEATSQDQPVTSQDQEARSQDPAAGSQTHEALDQEALDSDARIERMGRVAVLFGEITAATREFLRALAHTDRHRD